MVLVPGMYGTITTWYVSDFGGERHEAREIGSFGERGPKCKHVTIWWCLELGR